MSSLLLSLLLICSVFFVPSHGEKSKDESFTNEMKISTKTCQEPHFVLVHGYGGGAWNWFKIISLMEASGYNVTSLDLKGAGNDLTDPQTVHTFEDYNKPLIDYLEKLPDDEKVILVGHSVGGLSVTDASYKFSKKIQVAVYVAGVMLKHGYVTEQDVEDGLPEKHKIEPEIRRGRILHARVKSQDPVIREIISEEDDVLKRILYRIMPYETLLSARFEGNETDSVKRVYIKTLNDTTLLPKHQDAMLQRWPPSEIIEVESNHAIIFLDPFLLFDLLVTIANLAKCS